MNRTAAVASFSRLNNAGMGFDPTDDIDGWTLVRDADNTSDVAVYDDFGDVILVGTDGSGSDDSRWAVRLDTEAALLDVSEAAGAWSVTDDETGGAADAQRDVVAAIDAAREQGADDNRIRDAIRAGVDADRADPEAAVENFMGRY